jgi:hypothetical protein
VKHLTTPDSVKQNTRPVSAHLNEDRIMIYIDEAEQLNIKNRMGDALFIDLLKYVQAENKSDFPVEYEKLLGGGDYEIERGGETMQKTFKGLQLTLEYYVYAKLVKNNDSNVTRFGFTQKEDEYSSHHDLKVKLVAEKDALLVADGYLSDCIEYLNNSKNIVLFKKAGKARNRLRIEIIGN